MKRNDQIGKRIKQLREAKGLSKSDVARRCHVTTTAVWNWEENGIVARSETFALLASALGVREDFLRTGEGPPNPPAHTDGQTPAALAPRSVAAVIEQARSEIADITGVALSNVRLSVEFSSQ
jgi:transcriptional regulator with XRE-family HTH domain